MPGRIFWALRIKFRQHRIASTRPDRSGWSEDAVGAGALINALMDKVLVSQAAEVIDELDALL